MLSGRARVTILVDGREIKVVHLAKGHWIEVKRCAESGAIVTWVNQVAVERTPIYNDQRPCGFCKTPTGSSFYSGCNDDPCFCSSKCFHAHGLMEAGREE